MASAKRVKLHYSLCESAIPENLGADRAGEFWIARDTQSVWFVASDGTLGGFMGEIGGAALDRKRKLLESEGIKIANGRVVDLERTKHRF